MMGFLSQHSVVAYAMQFLIQEAQHVCEGLALREGRGARSGAVEGLRAQMWAESRPLLTAVPAVTALGWPHTNRPLGQETSLQPNCAPPAASPMLSTPPLPARSGHRAWMQVHPSGEAPPSNSPLHPTPGQLRVVECQMLVMGRKGTHASVLNSLQNGSQVEWTQ